MTIAEDVAKNNNAMKPMKKRVGLLVDMLYKYT